jgi:hypothetical protein
MKKYSLITIKFGEDMINFINGIMEFSSEDELEILVEKSAKNFNSILEAGVTFVTVGNSLRFYVKYDMVFGANI